MKLEDLQKLSEKAVDTGLDMTHQTHRVLTDDEVEQLFEREMRRATRELGYLPHHF